MAVTTVSLLVGGLFILHLLGMHMCEKIPGYQSRPSFKDPAAVNDTILWCSFEESCTSLKSLNDPEQYKWRRHPDHIKHSTKGFIMYTNATDGKPGDTAVLVSDLLTSQGPEACLSFWYHIEGSLEGTLSVRLTSERRNLVLLKKSGPTGKSEKNTAVQLSLAKGEQFQLFFIATRGKSNQDIIAIDDVSVTLSPCPNSPEGTWAWDEWNSWSACFGRCGEGIRMRLRACAKGKCVGDISENAPCDTGRLCRSARQAAAVVAWGSWNEWGGCSASCGYGNKTRIRSCGGANCPGDQSETVPCLKTPCDGCRKRMDLTIIVDSSGSIEDKGYGNWDLIKNFVNDIIEVMNVGTDEIQIALIRFSNGADVLFQLDRYSNKENMKTAVRNMDYDGGDTNTQLALFLARTVVHTETNGDRPGIPNVVIVITDGESTIMKENTVPEAQKLKQTGANILAVGVTNEVNQNELLGIASHPSWVFNAADFNKLPSILESLKKEACRTTPLIGKPSCWGNWGRCSATCNTGTQSRTRTCTGEVCPGLMRETRTCVVEDCNTICPGVADVCFIIDSSGSIEQKKKGNWNLQKEFIATFISQLDIGQYNTRIAAVQFSSTSKVIFNLANHFDKQVAVEAIRNLTYWSGGTHTALALRIMREQVFNVAHGDRPGVTNIGIVITDGNSIPNTTFTIPEANLAKAAGITMLSIGVTNDTNMTELEGMASKKDWVFRVERFEQLQDVQKAIVEATCQSVDGRWDMWGEWCGCSVTCGTGVTTRTRACQTENCRGQSTDNKPCTEQPCQARFNCWSNWGKCSVSCDMGTQTRTRTCDGQSCQGMSTETRQCQVVQCGTVCPGVADVCFIIDSSGSIEQKKKGNWDLQKNFIASFISQLDIGEHNTRISAVQFSSTSKVIFNLANHFDKHVAVEAIRNLTYWSGGTHTALALRIMREQVFNVAHGDRPGVTNIGIIITDGNSIPNTTFTIPEANLAKAAGITMLSIGVTNDTNMTELEGMASKKDWVFQVDKFEDLQDVQKAIVEATCQSVDGRWDYWGEWCGCTATCGTGVIKRTRACVTDKCRGPDEETKECQANVQCPIGSGETWGDWMDGVCSVTCGRGQMMQNRRCTSGNCIGQTQSRQVTCDKGACDAMWGSWTDGACSVSCGDGQMIQTRVCMSGNCQGQNTRQVACNMGNCQAASQWSQWGSWGSCSVTCGNGQERATRYCMSGSNCPGESTVIRDCIRSPCETWGQWTSGACSVTCGSGERIQTRSCMSGNCIGQTLSKQSACNMGVCPPAWGQWTNGACSVTCGNGQMTQTAGCASGNCLGQTRTRLVTCNMGACPDMWGPWGEYGSCSATCGGGMKTRTRTCVTGTCAGTTRTNEASCNENQCPVWGIWGTWQACSATCGGGRQMRVRRCINGPGCQGSNNEMQSCSEQVCPRWGPWSEWTCAVTCGIGGATRSRECITGNDCLGNKRQTQPCQGLPSCPAVEWTAWSAWSSCLQTCGDNVQKQRTRTCQGGTTCPGQAQDVASCNLNMCPEWSQWMAWAQCTRSCGGGIQQRVRLCRGEGCQGSPTNSQPCNTQACAVWNPWDAWGQCTASCGGGTQQRQRSCRGEGCPGSRTGSQPCNTQSCANWNDWSSWTTCTVQCGGGMQQRERTCGGTGCPGQPAESRLCNIQSCATGNWALWSDWTACSEPCGGGTTSRVRVCVGTGCQGIANQQNECNTKLCTWSDWASFSACTTTCGPGRQDRVRSCPVPGKCSPGGNSESRSCSIRPCGPGMWATWGAWSGCTASCNGGTRTRERMCNAVTCSGIGRMSEICEGQPCPTPQGTWGTWSAYSACSVTCGSGSQSRVRACVGGDNCLGSQTEQRLCHQNPCRGLRT